MQRLSRRALQDSAAGYIELRAVALAHEDRSRQQPRVAHSRGLGADILRQLDYALDAGGREPAYKEAVCGG